MGHFRSPLLRQILGVLSYFSAPGLPGGDRLLRHSCNFPVVSGLVNCRWNITSWWLGWVSRLPSPELPCFLPGQKGRPPPSAAPVSSVVLAGGGSYSGFMCPTPWKRERWLMNNESRESDVNYEGDTFCMYKACLLFLHVAENITLLLFSKVRFQETYLRRANVQQGKTNQDSKRTNYITTIPFTMSGHVCGLKKVLLTYCRLQIVY